MNYLKFILSILLMTWVLIIITFGFFEQEGYVFSDIFLVRTVEYLIAGIWGIIATCSPGIWTMLFVFIAEEFNINPPR